MFYILEEFPNYLFIIIYVYFLESWYSPMNQFNIFFKEYFENINFDKI